MVIVDTNTLSKEGRNRIL